LPAELGSPLCDAQTPYGYSGPLIRCAAAERAQDVLHHGLNCLRTTMRRLGVVTVFVRWNPLLTVRPENLPQGMAAHPHGEIVVIDLSKPDDTRWSEMRRNHRQNIDRLRAAGFEVQFENSDAAISTFAAMYRQTMQRVGASSQYFFDDAYLRGLINARGAAARLCLITQDGRPACGGLFLASVRILTCHLSATEEEFLSLSPTKLMFWAASCWGRAAGFGVLNIGGGVGGRQDSPLFRFKEGFSPDRRQFDTVSIICDQDEYERLCDRARAIHGAHHQDDRPLPFFPAYRRRDRM
jgi:hypothetical protein